jgi:hypothetical protein
MKVWKIIGGIILGIIFGPLIIALGLAVAAIVLVIVLISKIFRFITLAGFRERRAKRKNEQQ